MATRIEAAEAIAEIINQDDDHGARLWTKENAVRLYLKFNTNAKKGWIDNGFIAFNADGTVDVKAERSASVAKDAVRSFLASNTIGTVAKSAPVAEIEDENDFTPVRDVAGDERGY